jgi:poly(3-hydroxybutyrate) depolymerase
VRAPLSASIAYPLDLAQGLDEGSRDIVAYDFRAGLDRALALLAAAQTGRDPLWQARGDQPRAYRSALTGRIEPYRIYVPQGWDGHASLPLVVMLHGSNGDENSMFADGRAVALAEAHGGALLAPFGYSANGGWGNHLPVVLANGTMPAPRPSTRDGLVLPRDGIDPEPAEADVLETIARMRAEYPIDRARIYLLGNSMGGGRHMASRRPQRSVGGGGAWRRRDPAHFPYARLRTRRNGARREPARRSRHPSRAPRRGGRGRVV